MKRMKLSVSTIGKACTLDSSEVSRPKLPQEDELDFSFPQKQLDVFSKSVSESIYHQLNQIEVKLHILSAQQETIISRVSNINSRLKGKSWIKIQETFSKLPHYINVLGQMRNRMEKTLLLIRTFPARQAALIKTNNRIISLKKWKEEELNTRLQAEESKIQVHQVKLKVQRPISFACPVTEEPQEANSATPMSSSLTNSSHLKQERASSSSPKTSRSRKSHDKKKITPLFASLLSSLPPSSDSKENE
ncbi:hypothetical protein DSO57_1029025 [Entomophthora muscae]|uniref:Uncharacterized protein n=1 Tax=Entomophthora muscae TaxID=34485 RepID=A0ACC2S368_9FUNG|nr:hypothetical protein DSO57_1029025 [Entomophthora muscae]